MIRIRPYKASDVDTILSWCQNEKAFYQWTAGILGNYPITQKEFSFVESLMPFTAFDETGIVGFFTLRNPDESLDELRFGFVIVNPHKRGKGYGKAMLRLCGACKHVGKLKHKGRRNNKVKGQTDIHQHSG